MSRTSLALAIAGGAVAASTVALPIARAEAAPIPDRPAAKMEVPAVAYESPFKGYRMLEDQPVASWRDANDLVHRLGGWKAFASGRVPGDSQSPSDAGKATPARSAGETRPEQPRAPTAAGHSGHTTK